MDYVKQQDGKVAKVTYKPEHHGVLTCMVQINFGDGDTQTFGGLILDEKTGPQFVAELCAAFGVETYEQVVGLRCTALYLFPGWNERISALRGPRGVFDLHAWRQKMHPGLPSAVEERRLQMVSEVQRVEASLREKREELMAFEREHFLEKAG